MGTYQFTARMMDLQNALPLAHTPTMVELVESSTNNEYLLLEIDPR